MAKGQHNQDVNSLGLVSASKTEEAMEILKLMSATFLVGLCQAIDLRHVEETMQSAVKLVIQVAKKTLFMGSDGLLLPSHFCEKELLMAVDRQLVFSYIDGSTSDSYPLMEKLRGVLVSRALKSADKETSNAVFRQISVFEAEVKLQLSHVVPAVQEAYDTKGLSLVPDRIQDCRTYPLYKLVRGDLKTQLLSGQRTMSPGQEIEKVFNAISAGQLVAPLLECVQGWTGTPGPFPARASS
ncbi:phenylalanine ammonia-lyase [Physcomitrium patens]|uniref:Phenylalanine ammonia-lyase n=1 Tax=Physcomitrium patens TaxID=3218 RepID=A0A2K1ID34_PHYPA|nr:phenylalanine ammonia-lyase-like [Physcomitrium patens]PNR27176.1 hypothetical protein PHYPA_030657 [Physcomitrium patens]|eukprot:XP_024366399.1 phenylalanine ammonia-lyase-like [Physcomitrella patens]